MKEAYESLLKREQTYVKVRTAANMASTFSYNLHGHIEFYSKLNIGMRSVEYILIILS